MTHSHDTEDDLQSDCVFCAGRRAYEDGEAAEANPYPKARDVLRDQDFEAYAQTDWFLWESGYAAGSAWDWDEPRTEDGGHKFGAKRPDVESAWVGIVAAYPEMSFAAQTRSEALAGIKRMVADVEGRDLG